MQKNVNLPKSYFQESYKNHLRKHLRKYLIKSSKKISNIIGGAKKLRRYSSNKISNNASNKA